MGQWAPLIGLLVATLLAVAFAARPRSRTLPIDPVDRAELDAVGAALLAEHHAATEPLLVRRLRTLTGRGVPVSRVEATGIHGQWRLGFADSTSLLVRERRPGDMALLGVRLLSGRVRLASYELVTGGALLEVAWRGGRLRVLAVA